MESYQEYEKTVENNERSDHSTRDYHYMGIDSPSSFLDHSINPQLVPPELRHLRHGHPILFGSQEENERHEFSIDEIQRFSAPNQQTIRPSGTFEPQQKRNCAVRPPTPFEPYQKQIPQRSSISYALSSKKRQVDSQDRKSVRHERNAYTANAIPSLLQSSQDRQIRMSSTQHHNPPAMPIFYPKDTICERLRSPKYVPRPSSHCRTSSKHHLEFQDNSHQTGENSLKCARQEDSEEDKQKLAYGVAYSILGPLINANTAVIIFQLQGTQMDPGEVSKFPEHFFSFSTWFSVLQYLFGLS